MEFLLDLDRYIFNLATRRPALLGEQPLLAGLLLVSLLPRSDEDCLDGARTVDLDRDLEDMVNGFCFEITPSLARP